MSRIANKRKCEAVKNSDQNILCPLTSSYFRINKMSSTPNRPVSSNATTTARTPTVVPMIPVASNDVVVKLQQTFSDISQQYLDNEHWTPQQRRVLLGVFSKFAHNVFAHVRKNITVSSNPQQTSGVLTEPVDRALAAEVESLDEEVDAVSNRVAALREAVPRILDDLLQKQQTLPTNATTSDTSTVAGASNSSVGSVIAHVANEINTLAVEFKDVKKDVDTAVNDCQTTLQVVKRTLNKPESATQQVRFTFAVTNYC